MLDLTYLKRIFNVFILSLLIIHDVSSQCDGTGPLVLQSSTSPQYFTSPDYPSNYLPNTNCSWRIEAPTVDEKIIINVEDFKMAGTTVDYLNVYDSSDDSTTPVKTMYEANADSFNAYVSTTSALYITFISNEDTEVDRGFQILFFTSNPDNQAACGTTLTVTSQEQVFMSQNLPQPYNASICSWTFSSSAAILFQLKFLDLGGCLQSHITFYDGLSDSDPKLKELCHTALTYTFDNITTTGTDGYIAYRVTDQPNDYYGFMLVYGESQVTTTTTSIPTTTTSVPTTTTASPTTTLTPNIFDNCTASGAFLAASISPNFDYIYSPDYESGAYPSNTYCRWYITAPDNFAVEAYFDNDTYGIERNTYCRYDYVIFYDGNSTKDTMLNKFCGLIRPPTVYRSSSTQMLIVFNSDYIIQKAGFKIRIRAVDNTNPGCKAGYTTEAVLYNRLENYIFNNYTFINNISSPGFGTSDYPLNVEVFWLFFNGNTTGYRIVLDIISISIERSYKCIYDRLVLYDGPCIKDGIKDTVCGYWKKQWNLDGEEYLLHFHSDSYITQSGFLINYYAEEKTVPVADTTSTTTFGPPVGAVVAAVKEMLTNYSNENLPVRDFSEPVRAVVDFYFVGINGLDEVSQKLTSIGQFVVTWEDPSLTWDPTKRQGVVQVLLPQNDIWKPDIALINGFTKITAMGAKFMFIDINYNGSCIWKPYQVMDSVCHVDMTHYPYDRQICILKFGTWSSDDSQVITVLGKLGLQMHPNFQENAEWRLISTETKQMVNSLHKIVEFHITLERNSLYVTYYMTIPIIMLAYMNVFVFAVPCESGEKTGYSITIFLSLVVLLIINNQSLPNNSDTTSLFAVYVLAMTILSAIALIISTLEIRAIAFDERMFPIPKRLKKFIAFVNKIESLVLCDDADNTEFKTEVVELRPYRKESPKEKSGYRSPLLTSKHAETYENDDIDVSESYDLKNSERFAMPRNRKNNIVTLERQTTLFEENSLMRRSDTPSFEIHSPVSDVQTTTEEPFTSKNDNVYSRSSLTSETPVELSDHPTNEENGKDTDSHFEQESYTSMIHHSSEPQSKCETNDEERNIAFDPYSETSKKPYTCKQDSKLKNDKKDVDSLFDSESHSPMGQNLSDESFTLENETNLENKEDIDSLFDQEFDTSVTNGCYLTSGSESKLPKNNADNQYELHATDSDKNGYSLPPENAQTFTVEVSHSQNVKEFKRNELANKHDAEAVGKYVQTSQDKLHGHRDKRICSGDVVQEKQQSGSLIDEITELQPLTADDVKMNRPMSATENGAIFLSKSVSDRGLGSATTRNGRALSVSFGRPVLTRESNRVVSVLSKRPLSFVSRARRSSAVSQINNTYLLFDTYDEDDNEQEKRLKEDSESDHSNDHSSDEFKSSSLTESLGENGDKEEDLSWPDLVSCADIIFFIVYLLVTTVMSLALFITMVQAY